MNRFYARSASDKTDDWPFWFVADGNRGGLNVTSEVAMALGVGAPGAVFRNDLDAVRLAMRANRELDAAALVMISAPAARERAAE